MTPEERQRRIDAVTWAMASSSERFDILRTWYVEVAGYTSDDADWQAHFERLRNGITYPPGGPRA